MARCKTLRLGSNWRVQSSAGVRYFDSARRVNKYLAKLLPFLVGAYVASGSPIAPKRVSKTTNRRDMK